VNLVECGISIAVILRFVESTLYLVGSERGSIVAATNPNMSVA